MLIRFFAVALPLSTFCLILLGGVVHSTGASLACPDWPLCFGQVFPVMQGGVLYEHGHRLLASGVGVLSVLLAWQVFRQAALRAYRRAALGGVALVLLQASLGGLTVLWRLPPWVSTAHFAVSMLFLAWGLWLTQRLTQVAASGAKPAPRVVMTAAQLQRYKVAAGALYGQMVLGAALRHFGASLACGTQVFTCAGNWLPQTALQSLQTSHRLSALLVAGLVIAATVPVLQRARAMGSWRLWRLALASHLLVLLQLLLGVAVLRSMVQTHVVTTHLALGALLWGCMVLLWEALQPAASAMSHAAPASTDNFWRPSHVR